MTGRTEALSRKLQKPYIFRPEAFDDLHLQLSRTIEQYSEVVSEVDIICNFSDGRKEVFSSINRFREHQKSFSGVLESIVFVYEVIVELPKARDVSKFEVTVVCISGVGEHRKLKLQDPFSYRTASYFEEPHDTLVYRIGYTDYAIARSIEATIERWEAEVETERFTKWHELLIEFAKYSGRPIGFILGFAAYRYSLARPLSADNLHDSIMGSIGIVLLAGMAGWAVGLFVERIVAGSKPSSIMLFTRSDSTERQNRSKKLSRALLASISALLLAIFANILSTLVQSSWFE